MRNRWSSRALDLEENAGDIMWDEKIPSLELIRINKITNNKDEGEKVNKRVS